MKRGTIVIIVSAAIFLLCIELFGFNTTGYVTFVAQQNGNQINYQFGEVNDFIQCMDMEQENDIYKKGTCFTQLYKDGKIQGIGFQDVCKNNREVIQYYCSTSLTCTETASECPEDNVCDDGKCIKSIKPFAKLNLFKWISGFRSPFPF